VLPEDEAKQKIDPAEYKHVNMVQENHCTDPMEVSVAHAVGQGVGMCGAGAE